MRGIANFFLIFFVLSLFSPRAAPAAEKPFEFNDGDRIVFIGNDFFEREGDQNYIETRLTTRFPGKHLVFRNLGYAGDTVSGEARNLCAGWENFGPADQGFNRLKALVAHLHPTVIFVAYGMNESFRGDAGLADFGRGLSRLLDMLAEGKPHIVLISPVHHEGVGDFPNPIEHNQKLVKYVAAMGDEASRRGYRFINLFKSLQAYEPQTGNPRDALTRDGIHLTPRGYWNAAAAIEAGLGIEPRGWAVEMDAVGPTAQCQGTKIDHILSKDGQLAFQATDTVLPVATSPSGEITSPVRFLRISSLKGTGKYTLRSGDETVASATASQWEAGVNLVRGSAFDQVESVRQLIRLKNVDFFNYWRPENDTYILGYRNHEQGRNAVEIPLFEPLAAAKDAEIAKLSVPQPVSYTLTAEK